MTEPLNEQVDRLAQYILESIPGEPSQNEGAIDTIIRVHRALAVELERAREALRACHYHLAQPGDDTTSAELYTITPNERRQCERIIAHLLGDLTGARAQAHQVLKEKI